MNIVIELENNQQKFRNGWRGWVEFLHPLKFGHYKCKSHRGHTLVVWENDRDGFLTMCD